MRGKSKHIGRAVFMRAFVVGLIGWNSLFFLIITLAPSCPNSKSAEYYFTYGKHFMDERDYVEAQRNFTRAIKLKPDYFEAYTERAKAWELSDSLDRAIRDYDSLLTFKTLTVSQTADLHFNRANMYYLLSEDTLACKGWRKACDLNHNKSCDVIRKRCK